MGLYEFDDGITKPERTFLKPLMEFEYCDGSGGGNLPDIAGEGFWM